MLVTDIDGSTKQITEPIITKNGKSYKYLNNTDKKHSETTQKAAVLLGIEIILVDNASDMYANPLPNDYSVYILMSDYNKKGNGQLVSMKLSEAYVKVITNYRNELVTKGIIRTDTPLFEVYYGCLDDPDFQKNIKK